jgi:hypothetical protein
MAYLAFYGYYKAESYHSFRVLLNKVIFYYLGVGGIIAELILSCSLKTVLVLVLTI